jgi:hypothetical protein
MAVPKIGTYRAIDSYEGQYSFTVESARPGPGEIRGRYWTKGSRIGEFSSLLGDYPGDLVQQTSLSITASRSTSFTTHVCSLDHIFSQRPRNAFWLRARSL